MDWYGDLICFIKWFPKSCGYHDSWMEQMMEDPIKLWMMRGLERIWSISLAAPRCLISSTIGYMGKKSMNEHCPSPPLIIKGNEKFTFQALQLGQQRGATWPLKHFQVSLPRLKYFSLPEGQANDHVLLDLLKEPSKTNYSLEIPGQSLTQQLSKFKRNIMQPHWDRPDWTGWLLENGAPACIYHIYI